MTRARDLARFANNQAISVDTDFDVGINSSSPAATLDVRGNTVITGILTATSFSGNSTGLSGTPDITVNNIVAAGATFSGVLTYEDVTNVDSVGIVTARTGVEVTANGLVVNAGVSTFKSDVTIRSANPTLDLIDTDGSTTASLSANSGNIFYDTSSTNRDHVFQGASSEVARITGDGLVGIGTDIPAQKLHIHNNGASRILLKRVGSNPSEADIRNEGELLTFTQNTDGITFNTGSGTPSERFRIAASGQIGLGGANYGTSGQVITSNGSGSAPTWQNAGGITMAQQWRLTSDSTGNVTPLTAWEAIDTYGQGSLGSAMTASSGVFTYPSTGIYLVLFNLVGYSDNHSQNIIGQIQHTTNNSTYNDVAIGHQGIYDFNNSYPSWATTSAMYMFDITDTTNHKTRFTFGAGQGNESVKGHTSINYTTATFIRLGDT